ncbi:hypothetical protein Tco_1121045 [Tanacetum coccineum]|uniref:Uncharacterized protein n=1 Tax=Tanacetum coccineum TaxID=301880 RepID=A0ABQ5IY13_9ASTR
MQLTPGGGYAVGLLGGPDVGDPVVPGKRLKGTNWQWDGECLLSSTQFLETEFEMVLFEAIVISCWAGHDGAMVFIDPGAGFSLNVEGANVCESSMQAYGVYEESTRAKGGFGWAGRGYTKEFTEIFARELGEEVWPANVFCFWSVVTGLQDMAMVISHNMFRLEESCFEVGGKTIVLTSTVVSASQRIGHRQTDRETTYVLLPHIGAVDDRTCSLAYFKLGNIWECYFETDRSLKGRRMPIIGVGGVSAVPLSQALKPRVLNALFKALLEQAHQIVTFIVSMDFLVFGCNPLSTGISRIANDKSNITFCTKLPNVLTVILGITEEPQIHVQKGDIPVFCR